MFAENLSITNRGFSSTFWSQVLISCHLFWIRVFAQAQERLWDFLFCDRVTAQIAQLSGRRNRAHSHWFHAAFLVFLIWLGWATFKVSDGRWVWFISLLLDFSDKMLQFSTSKTNLEISYICQCCAFSHHLDGWPSGVGGVRLHDTQHGTGQFC